MNRLFTKKLLAAAVLALPCMASQAAQTITFPMGSIVASGSLYQAVTGLSSTGLLQQGQSSAMGYGSISAIGLAAGPGGINFPSTAACGVGYTLPCELTYAYSGFTYSGAFRNNTSNNTRDYFFTGGSLNLFFQSPGDASLPAVTGPMATLANFASKQATFTNGVSFLNSAAFADPTTLTVTGGGTQQMGQPTTVTTNPFAPTANLQGCTFIPGTFNGSNSASYSCPGATINTFNNATLKITETFTAAGVSTGRFEGQLYVNVTGGQAGQNFDHDSEYMHTDLAVSTTIASSSSCSFNNQSGLYYQLCQGSFTASGYVDPATVVLVPEPHTLAIFGLGLVGVGFLRRRREEQA